MKNTRILIPNGTGPRNLGDTAIRESLVDLIGRSISNPYITIHSGDVEYYSSNEKFIVRPTIYQWAVFNNKNLFVRIFRVSTLLVYYFLIKNNFTPKFNSQLNVLVGDYRDADIIIFTGGGYLRTKKGIKQSLNLLMYLFIFKFSQLFRSDIIATPMSFGPFAYFWQEKISASVLKDVKDVLVREKYSYELIKKYLTSNLKLSSDLALFSEDNNHGNKQSSNIVGFTARNWLKGEAQDKLERHIATNLKNFVLKTGLSVQPIIQVDAKEFGENDVEVTARIVKHLNDGKIDILPTIFLKNVQEAKLVYGMLDILLGMRMHSNIIAATQGTPFVGISYEYKTEGIAADLGVGDYVIPCDKVGQENLSDLLFDLYKNKEMVIKRISDSIQRIRHNIVEDISGIIKNNFMKRRGESEIGHLSKAQIN